jgi:hypothetical protein
MKLAEALVERKAAQEKISELSERLQRVAVIQEGEKPAEKPQTLLTELAKTCERLEELIVAINLTNTEATLEDGQTLTAAIAQRDVLRMRQGVLDTLIRTTGNPQYRMRGTEIKFVTTVDIAKLQRERDDLAKQYRELDTAIQGANWTAELIERLNE